MAAAIVASVQHHANSGGAHAHHTTHGHLLHHIAHHEDDCAELDENGEEPVMLTKKEEQKLQEEKAHHDREVKRLQRLGTAEALEHLAEIEKTWSHKSGSSTSLDGTVHGQDGTVHSQALGLQSMIPSDQKEKRGYHIRQNGVKMGIYTSWIREELDKEEACMELPFTITMLVAFSLMATFHLRQDSVMIVENAIQ